MCVYMRPCPAPTIRTPRRPTPADHGERLVNGAGIGYLRFDEDGEPFDIREFRADEPDVRFPERRGSGS